MTRGSLANQFRELSQSQILRYVLAFVVLPNAALHIVLVFYYGQRALLNLDYLGLAAVAPWVGAPLTAIGYAILFTVDIVFSGAPAFHFGLSGVMESLSVIGHLEAGFIVPIIVGLTIFVGTTTLTAFVLIRRRPNRVLLSLSMVLVAIPIVAADGLLSRNRYTDIDKPLLDNVATSVSVVAMDSMRQVISARNKRPDAYGVASASTIIFDQLAAGDKLPTNIVLIIVESMGTFLDSKANAVQLSAFRDEELNRKYTITTGKVPFRGSTVAGELRELCRVRLSTVAPSGSALPVPECLPNLLEAKGYETLAIHNFFGNTFGRTRWYPEIGFDDAVFADGLRLSTYEATGCGFSFNGVCDIDAAAWLGNQLRKSEDRKLFAYWLTLDGHLPAYPPRSTDPYSVSCSDGALLSNHRELCWLVQRHDVVMQQIVYLALDPSLPSTAFVVVGDHVPPFTNRTLRSQFDEKTVPMAVLWPNLATASAGVLPLQTIP